MKSISCLPNYTDADVISFKACLHKIDKFRAAVDNTFANSKLAYEISNALQSQLGVSSLGWLEEGVKCEILMLGGQSWQPGKIRITINVEFCPDQLVIAQKTVSNKIENNQPLLIDQPQNAPNG